MTFLQNIYNDAKSGLWARSEYDECACQGGWYVSQVDTIHKCFQHNFGYPHPEACSADTAEYFELRKGKSIVVFRKDAEDVFRVFPVLSQNERHCRFEGGVYNAEKARKTWAAMVADGWEKTL